MASRQPVRRGADGALAVALDTAVERRVLGSAWFRAGFAPVCTVPLAADIYVHVFGALDRPAVRALAGHGCDPILPGATARR